MGRWIDDLKEQIGKIELMKEREVDQTHTVSALLMTHYFIGHLFICNLMPLYLYSIPDLEWLFYEGYSS